MFRLVSTRIKDSIVEKPSLRYLPIKHSDYLGNKREYVVLDLRSAAFALLLAVVISCIAVFAVSKLEVNVISAFGMICVGLIPTNAGILEYFLFYRDILEKSAQSHFANLRVVKSWIWGTGTYDIHATGMGTTGTAYIDWLIQIAREDFPSLKPEDIKVVQYVRYNEAGGWGIQFPEQMSMDSLNYNDKYNPVLTL